jgi:hypothetical protein
MVICGEANHPFMKVYEQVKHLHSNAGLYKVAFDMEQCPDIFTEDEAQR